MATNRKRGNVPEEVWAKVRNEYITADNTSYRQLEKQFGLPFSAIRSRAVMEEWQKQRSEFHINRTQKSLDLIAEHQARETSKAFMVANKLLDKISEAVDVIEPADTQSIKQLTGAVKDLKEIGVFRADMDRREQMARIAKLEKEAKEEQTDTNIIVTLEGSVSEWSK